MDLPQRGDGRPIAIVIVGMAGTGKTTFASNLYAQLHRAGKRVYGINLDPAVDKVPFPVNIDIRKTVHYKNVMEQYGLGPNGAIMTALNLYATRFDKVLSLIEKRRGEIDYILIDTPGQIEVFNWSASGTIILDSLALSVPTLIAFAIDSVRCQKPTTLMANMMYACSVLYKSKLPFIGVFTKSDLADPSQLMEWISNPTVFAEAANEEDTYAATLSKSCAYALSSFYDAFERVAVGAATDVDPRVRGYDVFVEKVQSILDEYYDVYLKWIVEQRENMEKERKSQVQEGHQRFEQETTTE